MRLNYLLSLLVLCCCFFPLRAEGRFAAFKGLYYCQSEKVYLTLDLDSASVQVPGMDFLGKVRGLLHGNIYGVWMVTGAQLQHGKVVVRFSNDSGADSQSVELALKGDSLLQYKAINGNEIKRVEHRKLVKVPGKMDFMRLR